MNERDWVPAHRRLFKGAKKGLPRAVRFVLLELCHEARPTGGILEFPPEWDTLTAVHDRIGGDRKEIRKALTIFQIPDADGLQVLQIERDATKHRLQIVKWGSWTSPKSGAERNEEYRKRRVANSNASRAISDVTPTVQDSTEQESTEQERERTDAREERQSERRLKSVPPPRLEPSEAAALAHTTTPDVRENQTGPSEDAATRKGAGAGAVASGGSENGYALAHRVWHELWAAKYRRRYEQVGGPLQGPQNDDGVLQRLGAMAMAKGNPGAAEAYLRHKISAYLKDHGDRNWLAENCHPLRTIERSWNKYGEPKEPRRMVPRRDEEPVELVSLADMAARAEAIKKAAGGSST